MQVSGKGGAPAARWSPSTRTNLSRWSGEPRTRATCSRTIRTPPGRPCPQQVHQVELDVVPFDLDERRAHLRLDPDEAGQCVHQASIRERVAGGPAVLPDAIGRPTHGQRGLPARQPSTGSKPPVRMTSATNDAAFDAPGRRPASSLR
jgi:hypothetical protein